MSKEELYDRERELCLIEAAQQGDDSAEEMLVSTHQPLIRLLAKRMHVSAGMLEELVQAGNIGLIQAIRRFSPENNTRLTTYAVPWILGEMKQILRNQDWFAIPFSPEEGERLFSAETIDLGGIDLRFALERLEESERILIFLRFFREKTQKETALLLHRSQSQISKLERRALDRLRELLN